MKKLIAWCLASLFIITAASAQDETQKQLLREGTALHDKGDYEGAVKKYDEVIALNANYVSAYYEKAYTLYAMNKLEECKTLCENIFSRFKDSPERKEVYVVYGNCLDQLKQPDAALKAYDEGIKQFPNDYMLYYNKAITLNGQEKADEALPYFEKAISLNPKHASSHKAICALLMEKNKIPSLMAGIAFLCYEPQGKRAESVLAVVKKHLAGNVKKEGDKNVTIMINADDLDTGKKAKKKENNFGMVSLMLSMSSAIDNDSTLKSAGEAGRLSLKIQMLANSLSENKKNGSGFYWEKYAPFIIDMKKQNQVETFAHVALASDQTDENNTWFQSHKDELNAFFDWLKNYQWGGK